jgi:DnaJ-class molecular chaperone
MIITYHIKTPTKLSEKEIALFKELQKIEAK